MDYIGRGDYPYINGLALKATMPDPIKCSWSLQYVSFMLVLTATELVTANVDVLSATELEIAELCPEDFGPTACALVALAFCDGAWGCKIVGWFLTPWHLALEKQVLAVTEPETAKLRETGVKLGPWCVPTERSPNQLARASPLGDQLGPGCVTAAEELSRGPNVSYWHVLPVHPAGALVCPTGGAFSQRPGV
eukprot:1157900-Pelagomonas_calceolata.AAC.9